MKNRYRVQFDISKEKYDTYQELMQQCDIKSNNELFNSALSLLEWAIKEVKTDRIIASIDLTNEKYKELVMPILQGAKKRK